MSLSADGLEFIAKGILKALGVPAPLVNAVYGFDASSIEIEHLTFAELKPDVDGYRRVQAMITILLPPTEQSAHPDPGE